MISNYLLNRTGRLNWVASWLPIRKIFNKENYMTFSKVTKKASKELIGIAVTKLFPFSSTYSCNHIFSMLISIKMENRNKIDAESCLILAVSSNLDTDKWSNWGRSTIHLIKRFLPINFLLFIFDNYSSKCNIFMLLWLIVNL